MSLPSIRGSPEPVFLWRSRLADCEAIIAGKYDAMTEDWFYMKGALPKGASVNTFRLRLMSPIQLEQIDDIVSFTAKDASGSFGILANAFRRITALSFGMASLRKSDGNSSISRFPVEFSTFLSNELKIATTTFVRSRDIKEISRPLWIRKSASKKKISVISSEACISSTKKSSERLSSMSRMGGDDVRLETRGEAEV